MTVARHLRLIATTAQLDDPIATIAARMHQAGIDCAPVLDDHGRLLGLVTARDFALEVVGKGLDPATTSVRDVMQRDVATVLLDASAEQALSLMREHRTQRLLVLDDHRKLLGMVWLYDIAEAIVGPFGQLEDTNLGIGDENRVIAVRARDVVILRRPPASVLAAMHAADSARKQEQAKFEPKAAGRSVPLGNRWRRQLRHKCRGRWCSGGKSCEHPGSNR